MSSGKSLKTRAQNAKLRILLTNDDGILSEGTLPLIKELSAFGEVKAVVPDRPRNASSHSISLHKALRLKKINENVYVSDGTPVDCARLGVVEVFGDRVDFVLSGINAGPNLGDDINYSGTVAAAREAAFLGIKSASVSLLKPSRTEFAKALKITRELFPELVSAKLPRGTFLNVNIPPGRIRGLKVTAQGRRIYGRAIDVRKDPRGRKYYWLAGKKLSGFMIAGTDIDASEKGYVSVTPVSLDHTARGVLKNIRKAFEKKR